MGVTETATVQRGLFLARVVSNESICREHFRFGLEVEDFPAAAPGQFLQILCADPTSANDPFRAASASERSLTNRSLALAARNATTGQSGAFIRRPFSIGGLRRNGRRCEIDILHRVVGPGTLWLSHLKPGDSVSILGPLGQRFQIEENRPIAYLVGGGIGLPPLIWLAETLARANRRTLAFCGSRSGDLLPLTRCNGVQVCGQDGTLAYREFAAFNTPVILSTDDGSLGAAGRIPDVFADYLDRHADDARSAVVYTCGPDRMMHAVAKICEQRHIPCQVCLERMMACGMATCQSCVVAVYDQQAEDGWRYRLCCTDGPVFDSRVVIW